MLPAFPSPAVCRERPCLQCGRLKKRSLGLTWLQVLALLAGDPETVTSPLQVSQKNSGMDHCTQLHQGGYSATHPRSVPSGPCLGESLHGHSLVLPQLLKSHPRSRPIHYHEHYTAQVKHTSPASTGPGPQQASDGEVEDG